MMARLLPIVLLLLWLGASALIFYAWARRRKARGAAAAASATAGGTPTTDGCTSHGGICCGLHEVCEKGLPKRSDDLYFDDEELDRFTGRTPDSYTPEEVDEFRRVMLTTLPEELTEWARCIGRRGITLPTSLRAELLALISRAG